MKFVGSIHVFGPDSKIKLNHNPDNLEYSGFIIEGIIGTAVKKGQALYYNTITNDWRLSKSNSLDTLPCRGISCENNNIGTTIKILKKGTMKNDNWKFINKYIYVSDTIEGLITHVKPESPNSHVQVIGTPIGVNVGYFDFCPFTIHLL